MIDSRKPTEKLLQNRRFKIAIPYLAGDVLDFGGNEGELKKFVRGEYTLVNYDHSPMEGKTFDTIVALAVIEHINVSEVYEIFKKFKEKLRPSGKIILTTPTKTAKPILNFMVHLGLADKENIAEHKHYWTKKEILDLAEKTGFKIKRYKKFQLGFNQLAIFEHK
ncbi:class I SAM-dependent methyltransferase [Patescibacteria group bacterium]|nr:class I SAM-dependent methyltransferase [Patescibacteria group bacterium]